MFKTTTAGALSVLLLICSCGGDDGPSPGTDPDTEDFELDPQVEEEIEAAAAAGLAEASYEYDAENDRLTISITSSSFACEIETGTFEAIVTSLTQSTMVWAFEDDDGGVTWTREDDGPLGVVGVWSTDDPELFLILSADGDAQLMGAFECNEDRPRNENNCLELKTSGATVTIDGDLSDWSGLPGDASLDDPAGDYSGSDAGADVAGMSVARQNSSLSILMSLHTAPSENFRASAAPNDGVYRLTIRGDNGLSFGERFFFNGETWQTMGDTDEITAAAGADGIEWDVDLSEYEGEGFETVDFIMVEPMGCGSGSCQMLDGVECGYVEFTN